jgi:photosystem II stability/assembly factor-like uncharacterized protein
MGKNTNSILAILFAGLLIMLSGCNLPVSATPTSEHPTLTETITPTPTASPTPERTPERQYLSSPGLIWFEMTDATHGWGMNLDSVLRTEDGGEHWYVTGLTGILELPYRGRADFLDAQVGWVLVADPLDQTTGQIYRTADGGESWQQFETPFARGEISPLDDQQAFVLVNLDAAAGSSSIAIYQTSDSGTSWQPVYQINPNNPAQGGIPFSGMKNGIAFKDAQRGWVTGSIPMEGYPYLFKTDNGGLAWNLQDIPLPTGHEKDFIEPSPPAFFSVTEGVLPARLYGEQLQTVFYHTDDGGDTWYPATPVPNAGPYDFLDIRTGWIWDGITLHSTSDGGVTWSARATDFDPAQQVAMLSLLSEMSGLALVFEPDGASQLYRTSDGGQSWSVLP